MAEGGSPHGNYCDEEVNSRIVRGAAVIISTDGTPWPISRLVAEDGAEQLKFSRSKPSLSDLLPEESVSTWDGNDPAICYDGGQQRLSPINFPQGDMFTFDTDTQPLKFSSTYEAMEELPIRPLERACSAIVVSKSSCYDSKIHSFQRSKSWPGTPCQLKHDESFWSEEETSFLEKAENVVDAPKKHEMFGSGHQNLDNNSGSLGEPECDYVRPIVLNCEEAAAILNVDQDLNECAVVSVTSDTQDSKSSGSLVGLRSCSVDSEPAFDSRERHESDSAHSYEAEVGFPDGINAVQAPVSAAYSDPDTSPLREVVRQEVNSFGGFQDISAYRTAVTPGIGKFDVIFTSSEEVCGIDFTQKFRIGRGGRNVVYSDRNGALALKKCRYQKDVLNITYKLKHPNVISLLGVALPNPRTSFCWQVMKRMNTDLHQAWEPYRSDGLVKCLLSLDQNFADMLLLNVVYITKEVAKALVYLKSLGIIHGDIKGPNILLSRCMECRSQFECSCHRKYAVVIADFDSVCYVGGDPSHSHTGGTVGCRAPEVCIRGQGIEMNLCRCCLKSDVYSLGVVVLKMLAGRKIKAQARRDANILNRDPTLRDTLSERNELNYISTLTNMLYDIIMGVNIEGLKFLLRIAVHCSKPDVAQRLSPNELLEKLESYKILS